MWTPQNRKHYDRSQLRYPSDLTDAEWAHIAPRIPPAKPGGNKRTVDIREVVNGVMYVLSTGCQTAGVAQGLAAQEHGARLCDLVDLRRHSRPHSPCALCRVPGTS